MKKQLDQKDYHLLSLLRQNARQSLAQLAKYIGLSRTATQERLQRLERDHVIESYTIIEGAHHYAPRMNALALIRIHPSFNNAILAQLAKLPEITLCQTVSGRFDILCHIETPTLEDLDALLDDIGTLEGVEETHSHIILSTKFRR